MFWKGLGDRSVCLSQRWRIVTKKYASTKKGRRESWARHFTELLVSIIIRRAHAHEMGCGVASMHHYSAPVCPYHTHEKHQHRSCSRKWSTWVWANKSLAGGAHWGMSKQSAQGFVCLGGKVPPRHWADAGEWFSTHVTHQGREGHL